MVELGQVGTGDRIDQHGPCLVPAELDEKSAVTVPEAGGALGVDGDRPGSLSKPSGGLGQVLGSCDQAWQPTRRGADPAPTCGPRPSPATRTPASRTRSPPAHPSWCQNLP